MSIAQTPWSRRFATCSTGCTTDARPNWWLKCQGADKGNMLNNEPNNRIQLTGPAFCGMKSLSPARSTASEAFGGARNPSRVGDRLRNGDTCSVALTKQEEKSPCTE